MCESFDNDIDELFSQLKIDIIEMLENYKNFKEKRTDKIKVPNIIFVELKKNLNNIKLNSDNMRQAVHLRFTMENFQSKPRSSKKNKLANQNKLLKLNDFSTKNNSAQKFSGDEIDELIKELKE